MSRSTMSSRERMLAALNRQPADHIPCSPIMSQGPWFKEPLYWRDQFERADRMLELGLDPVIDIYYPDPLPSKEVEIKTWRDTSGPEPIITKEYHTPAGPIALKLRETEDWCDPMHCHAVPTIFGIEKRSHFNVDLLDDHNIHRRVEPMVKGREDLDKLRYVVQPPQGWVLDEWLMDAQRAIEFAKKRDILTHARRTVVGDAFQWLCDIEQFVYQMIDEPEFVQEFLGIFQDWALKMTQYAIELGVDVLQRRGAYEMSSYWGVKYWQEYLMPLIEEETTLVHQAGKLHSYFQLEGQAIYAPLLKEMGVDILWGLDPLELKGDIHTMVDLLADTKSFWGGISAHLTLCSNDKAQIRKAVKDAVDILGVKNGLVLSSYMFREIPHEAIMEMIDAWRDYCLK